MKRLFVRAGLVLVLAACAGEAPRPVKYIEGSACIHPGGRCDYSDQCCSQTCDASYCRGPMPPSGTP
jgi:hypothetical protein